MRFKEHLIHWVLVECPLYACVYVLLCSISLVSPKNPTVNHVKFSFQYGLRERDFWVCNHIKNMSFHSFLCDPSFIWNGGNLNMNYNVDWHAAHHCRGMKAVYYSYCCKNWDLTAASLSFHTIKLIIRLNNQKTKSKRVVVTCMQPDIVHHHT